MRLIRFSTDNDPSPRVGLLDDCDRVAELTGHLGDWTEALAAADALPEVEATHGIDDVTLLAPYAGGRIICAAVNYAAHREEMARAATEKPTLFLRGAESMVGPGEELWSPALSDQYDYEGELAVVIGTAGRRIGREAALAHVAGWTCFMDGTIRDWQRHTTQFTPGKNFDRSGAIGPWLVTRQAFGDYKARTLKTRLDGVEVQRTAIDLMLFDVEALIAYVSAFTELRVGDVIATGTCGGVGDKRVPPLFMKPGATIEVEIDGIGTLSNPVVADRFVA